MKNIERKDRLLVATANREEWYKSFQKFRSEIDVWLELILRNGSGQSYEFRVFLTPDVENWQAGLTGDKRKIAFRRSKSNILFSDWEAESILEDGAELLYEMMDTGYVMCSIYGYHTNYSFAAERMIVFDDHCDPHSLSLNGVPRQHWRAFQSYMRITSVDEIHSYADRIHVNWLRWSCRVLDREKKLLYPKFAIYGYKLSMWITITIIAAVISSASEVIFSSPS